MLINQYRGRYIIGKYNREVCREDGIYNIHREIYIGREVYIGREGT